MIHIIDDDPCILSILSEIMKALDYPAATFSCPNNYCEYANSNNYEHPNIIITDVTMPELNGYQLMKNVSAIHKEVKFIVMTGYQDTTNELSEHPHIFMKKPFRPKELDMNIQQLINAA